MDGEYAPTQGPNRTALIVVIVLIALVAVGGAGAVIYMRSRGGEEAPPPAAPGVNATPPVNGAEPPATNGATNAPAVEAPVTHPDTAIVTPGFTGYKAPTDIKYDTEIEATDAEKTLWGYPSYAKVIYKWVLPKDGGPPARIIVSAPPAPVPDPHAPLPTKPKSPAK